MTHISNFFNDRVINWLWWSGLALNLFLWAGLRWTMQYQSDPVNLHYTVYFGIDRIGSWWEIWRIPLTGFAFHIANFIFAGFLYKKEAYTLSRVFAAVTVMIDIMFIGVGIFVVLLNR